MHFGALLGLLLIKSREDDLKALEKLPDTLMEMDLDFAAFGLAYRLGGKNNMPDTFPKGLGGKDVDDDDFFASWLTQPAHEDLPDAPDYYLSGEVQLHSLTLGCDFIITTPQSSPEVDIAEYIAAALESFLSTTIELNAMSLDSSVLINIIKDEALDDDINYEINTDGKLKIDVRCGNINPHALSITQQEKISSKVSEIVLHLIARTIRFKDTEADLEKLFKDEEVNSRAFGFSSPLIRLGNVIGYNHKRSILGWINEDNKTYPYISGKCPLTIPLKIERKKVDLNSEDTRSLSHSEIRNTSMIRAHLWEEAKWKGALYITGPSMPPIFGLLYENEKAAQSIFKDWKETLGEIDKSEKIRLTIVRGIDADHQSWYRLGIGTNHDKDNPPSGKVTSVTRLHTMTPDSTANLDRFMESFNEYGFYLFAPAFYPKGESVPKVLVDTGIVKHQIIEKNAWEIGPNDLDMMTLTLDTNPIIPPGITSAPVLETLKKIAAMVAKGKK